MHYNNVQFSGFDVLSLSDTLQSGLQLRILILCGIIVKTMSKKTVCKFVFCVYTISDINAMIFSLEFENVDVC